MFGMSRRDLEETLAPTVAEIVEQLAEIRDTLSDIQTRVDHLWAKEFEPWRRKLIEEGYSEEEIEAIRTLRWMEETSPHPLAPVVTTWSEMYSEVAKKYLDKAP